MKNPVLILLCLLFLCSSCLVFEPYTITRFDFPLKPSEKVDVFYPGELLPDKDYIRVGVISVKNLGANSHSTCIRELQKMAYKGGVDALIEIEEVPGEYIGTTFTQAVCIKYIRNLNYLDQYVKKESFSEINFYTQEKKLIGVIERTPKGKTISSKFIEDDFRHLYETYIMNYRDFHLIDEKENWKYRLDSKKVKVLGRQYYRTDSWALKTCKYKYIENKLSEIKISNHDTFEDQTIFYTYNPTGTISERKLQIGKDKQVTETYRYDKEGRVSGKELRLMIEGAKHPRLFAIEFEYYKKEDIHDFINL